MSSPLKKKIKMEEGDVNIVVPVNQLKRECETESSSKRIKVEENQNAVDIQSLKRKNFITACKQVSYNAYSDFATRFQLVYLPPCINPETCNHLDYGKATNIMAIPEYAIQSIKIEMNTYTWSEALEICQLCLTPEQYLTADILRDIVEIMMNAQDDTLSDHSIDFLLDRCQQILSQSFSLHPPCVMKTLRNLYNQFLNSPMDLKEKTYSNRKDFGYDKGIVKYCMNRLEYELSLDSKDEAIIDKDQYISEEMTKTVKGLHWQKEKFEIFEVLDRPERIKRLMTVLESLVELLQFDLAIWHSRCKNRYSVRVTKCLLSCVLWSDNELYNELYIGAVNNSVRQILRLFVHMIHMQYPEHHIRIMSTWLTVLIQLFYICERKSNTDYPTTSICCARFAKEFYKIIAEMPQATIIRVLEQIYPTFMQHLIGLLHIQTLLSTSETDIIKIFFMFVKESQWNKFLDNPNEIHIARSNLIRPKKVKDFMTFLSTIMKNATDLEDSEEYVYPKLDPESLLNNTEIDRIHVVHALYITVDAFLDAYGVQNFQDTLDNLNEQVEQNGDVEMTFVSEMSSYIVTEHFIKKYRSIYTSLKDLIPVLQRLDRKEIPEIKIFERIGLLTCNTEIII